jgi:hypothetical protein
MAFVSGNGDNRVTRALSVSRGGTQLKTGLHPFENAPVRTAVRFPLQIATILCTAERSYPAVTEDISSSGVLFVAEEVPPVGARIEFTMKMPAGVMGGTEDVLLDCVGHIVRHGRPDGRRRAAAVIDEYSLRSEHA